MIQELNNLLQGFINSLSNRPIETVLGLLLLLTAYIAYRSYDRLENMIVTPQEEAARFERQLESSDLVNKAIENLRVELNADNVIIKQFHNGRHDLTGIPFTEASTTFISTEEGHDLAREEPIPTMNKSLRLVWKTIDSPQCVTLNAPVDISTRSYFYTHKVNTAVICPLVNLLNYPIGVIVVGFSEGNTNTEIAVTRTSLIGKRVTGYLNDY